MDAITIEQMVNLLRWQPDIEEIWYESGMF